MQIKPTLKAISITFSNITEFKDKGRNNIFKGLDSDLAVSVTSRSTRQLSKRIMEHSFYSQHHTQNLQMTQPGPKMKFSFLATPLSQPSFLPGDCNPLHHSKSSHFLVSQLSYSLEFHIIHFYQLLPISVYYQHPRQETNCPPQL